MASRRASSYSSFFVKLSSGVDGSSSITGSSIPRSFCQDASGVSAPSSLSSLSSLSPPPPAPSSPDEDCPGLSCWATFLTFFGRGGVDGSFRFDRFGSIATRLSHPFQSHLPYIYKTKPCCTTTQLRFGRTNSEKTHRRCCLPFSKDHLKMTRRFLWALKNTIVQNSSKIWCEQPGRGVNNIQKGEHFCISWNLGVMLNRYRPLHAYSFVTTVIIL